MLAAVNSQGIVTHSVYHVLDTQERAGGRWSAGIVWSEVRRVCVHLPFTVDHHGHLSPPQALCLMPLCPVPLLGQVAPLQPPCLPLLCHLG